MTLSRRNRLFLGILLIYAAGAAFLLYRVVGDLDPRYRESAEESLVETAQLLATLAEQDLRGGAPDPARLAPVFSALYQRRFTAQIFGVTKTRVELRTYLTDARGRVLFDSLGRDMGADFSQWRDVARALRGEYGARTSAELPHRPDSSVMYVGAPVRAPDGAIVGAVSVGKPVQSFGQFVSAAREKTIYVGLGSVAATLLLAATVSLWLVLPAGLITGALRYARGPDGRTSPGRLLHYALEALRAAYQEVRDALAGRSYVADYVQTLTHEVKSPLSAIRGAAELLQEPGMPEPDRQRFLANIARETQRIQELVDRMMELTALESRRVLERVEPVALRELMEEAANAARPAAAARGIQLALAPGEAATVLGDPFLLRRALSNLLDNAVDFSPPGTEIRLALQRQGRQAALSVRDQGPGIPTYAAERVFEKFYSLARPHSQKKSTGLGLPFVREIATLHRGRIRLANVPGGGAEAVLTLPMADGHRPRGG